MKKGLSSVVAVVILSLFVGCAGKGEGPASESKTINVSVGMTSDPGSLEPWQPSNDGKKMYVEVYETLFGYTGFGSNLVNIVGKSYEQMDDYRYRIKIYEYVYDTNGNQIKADDVQWSYSMCIDGGGFNDRVKDITSIDVIDDYTLDFTYSAVMSKAQFESSMQVYIVDRNSYESMGSREFSLHPVATGPYKFADYTTGSFYTIVKNEKYWQSEELRSAIQRQNCDKITYKIISDATQMAIALEAGEIDLANVDAENISYFYNIEAGRALDDWYCQTELAVPCTALIFNCSEDSVLRDQNLRLAICYAVDNQAMLDMVANGQGEVEYTNGGQQYFGFQEAMKREAATNIYSLDINKAREYLAKAGYDNGRLRVRIMCQIFMQNVAVVLQSQLLKAGIQSEILAYEPALAEAYATESDQFDLRVSFMGKSSGILSDYWGHHLATYSYGAANLINDPALEELYGKSISPVATDADVLACHDYFTEKAYFYGLYNGLNYFVGTKGVTAIIASGQFGIIPGGCAYGSDFVSKN
jgi:ABC-type transport system substrate-binding protein